MDVSGHHIELILTDLGFLNPEDGNHRVSRNVGSYHYSLRNNPEERSLKWLTCSTVCFLQVIKLASLFIMKHKHQLSLMILQSGSRVESTLLPAGPTSFSLKTARSLARGY